MLRFHNATLLTNLGDADPINHGGYFVLDLGKNRYQVEYLDAPDDDNGQWTVYRFDIDKCTYIDGILSDNEFHPELSAWFAPSKKERDDRPQDSNLGSVANNSGCHENGLIDMLCSNDPIDRAHAYRTIAEYHGYDNFDSYPLTFDRAGIVDRYGPKHMVGTCYQYDPEENPSDPDDVLTDDDWQDVSAEYWHDAMSPAKDTSVTYVGTRRIDDMRYHVWFDGNSYFAQMANMIP